MTAHVRVRSTCRLCGSHRLDCTVPLRAVPILSPNVGHDDSAAITAPLDLYLCRDCGLVQLVHVVDPSLIYRNYLYRTQVSQGMAEHFASLAATVIARADLRPAEFVLEFGSNDGTLLASFKRAGLRVLGIDPAIAIAAEATRRGIPTRSDFFGADLAASVRAETGPARAVLANNAMANIDDLEDVLHGVAALLAPDGVFVFETQYALDVLEKTLLDVIYHEHVSCFSVRPVLHALGRFGLTLFDAERIETKGGSIRFWVQRIGGPHPREPRLDDLLAAEAAQGLYDPEAHRRFGARVGTLRQTLHDVIAEAERSQRPIAAYGTSVGCAALIHQFELESRLDMLFDDSPFKVSLSGPGYALPVHGAEGVAVYDPALIVILAWRYADAIMAKHARYTGLGGRFVVPLPGIAVHPR